MSQQIINVGNLPDNGDGDPLRTAFIKTNDNFTEIYTAGPVGSNIQIANNTISTSVLNGNIVLSPRGIGVVQLNTSIMPRIDNVYDLGTPTQRFNTLYLGTGGFDSVGNITGNYFIGNGALLTGVLAAAGPNIKFGNSIVEIQGVNGNVVFTIDSKSNVIVVTPSNVSIDATLSVSNAAYLSNILVVSGNATTANLTTGIANVAQLDATGTATVIGNITGGNLTTTGTANVGSLTVTGTTTIGGTANITGNVTAPWFVGNVSGNVHGNFIVPGSNTQILFNDNGYANASSGLTFNRATNALTTAGNINSANLYVSGDGLVAGNLTVNGNVSYINVTNLNVQDPIIGIGRGANNAPLTTNDGKDRGEQLWYYSGSEKSAFVGYDNSAANLVLATDVSVSNEIVTVNNYGNVTLGNLSSQYLVASANVNAGNIISSGVVSVTGNITGGNLTTTGLANVGTLAVTGNQTVGGNSNVTGNQTVGGNSNVTGNITGGNLTTTGLANVGTLAVTGTASVTGNITGGNLTTTGTANVGTLAVVNNQTVGGNSNITGNITGGNLTTTGTANVGTLAVTGTTSLVGNITTNANITGNIAGANISTPGLISATGNITGGNLTTAGTANVGTLAVTGNATIAGNTSFTGNISAGNIFTTGTANVGTLAVTGTASVTGNITSNVNVTANIAGGNISTPGLISATGNITGGNLTTTGTANIGTLAVTGTTSLTGNITTNANITGNVNGGNVNTVGTANVGTLAVTGTTSLVGNVTSNVNVTANIAGGNISTPGLISATGNITSGANISGNFVAAGSNRQVMFNDNGLISSSSLMTFDKAGPTLSLTNAAGTIITGYVSSLGGTDLSLTPGTSIVVAWANVNPRFSNTWTLGTSSFQWKNIFAGNANIGALTVYGATTLTGNVSVTANLSAGNISTAGIVSATGNITGGNLTTAGTANIGTLEVTGTTTLTGNTSVTANLSAGNISTAGIVSATGNITGGNLTTAGNVSASSASLSSVLNVTGNATAGNLTTTGTANVGTLAVVGTATISGNANVTGNITGNYITAQSNIAVLGNKITSGTTTGLVFETGNVSLISGNIIVTGGYIYSQNGDTAITLVNNGEIGSVGIHNNLQVGKDGQGNIDVAGYANITGNAIVGGIASVTGNVTGGNLNTAGQLVATGNVTGGNLVTGGIVDSTGNVNTSASLNAASVYTANINAPSAGIALAAAAGNNSIFLQPSGTGTVDVADKRITNVGTPSAADDAATKEYVDNAASAGIHIHEPVRLETGSALTATYANGGTAVTVDSISGNKTLQFTTSPGLVVNDMIVFSGSFNGLTANTAYFVYSTNGTNQVTLSASYGGVELTGLTNGGPGLAQSALVNSGIGAYLTNAGANAVFSADSTTANVNDRILVYNQANAAWNGVYSVTTAGNASVRWVLTRATDADYYSPNVTDGASEGDYFYVTSGTTGAGESYVLTAPTGPIIFGTSNIVYTQFSASQVYSGANGVAITGAVISANVDNDTTAISSGNIVVKAGANLITPNIGAATGTSLSVTGNITANNITANTYLAATIINASANISGGNIISNGVASITGNISGANLYINNEANISGNLHSLGNAHFGQDLSFAAAGANMQYAGSANSYVQFVMQNKNNGVNASTDLVATADNGTDSDTFIDVGINSSQYNQAAYELAGPNDGYLLVYGNTTTGGGALVLSTFTNKDIIFSTGGGANINETARFQHGNGFHVVGNIYAPWFVGNVSGNISGNLNVAGPNTGILFNDDGVANSVTAFTFDKSTNAVSLSGNITTSNLISNGLISATGNVTGGNLVTAGNINATGNIAGNFVLGNGYYLTGIITSVANINNGTSNVRIDSSGGNILANVNGIANVVSITQEGLVLGNTTTANITTASAPLWITPADGQYVSLNSNNYSQLYYTSNIANIDPSGNDSYAWVYVHQDGVYVETNPSAGNQYQWTWNSSNGVVTTNYDIVTTGNVNVDWLESASDVLANANVTATGNVQGNYILGNGAFLSGVITSVANINNGTSNVRIDTSGGNILANVGGVANVLALTPIGANITGNLDVTSNVSAAYFLGNANASSLTSGTVPSARLSGTYAIDISGLAATANTVTDAAQPNITSVGTLGSLTVSGNISAGNVSTTGLISSDTLDVAGNASAGNLTVSGTIAGQFYAPGADGQIVFNDNSYANASSGLTFNKTTDALTVSGNINGSNLNVTGKVVATGNVSGDYILGNGSLLSGIITSVANINNGTSNVRIDLANGNIAANVGGTANVMVLSTVGANITGNMYATGNVSGDYILGNGSLLSGIITSVANINNGTSNVRIDTAGGNILANVGGTANVLEIASTGVYVTGLANISGNVTGSNLTTAGIANVGSLSVVGDALVAGNLTVNGNTNYINVTNLNVQDPIIGIGRGANNAPLVANDGKDRGEQLWYYSGSEKSAFIGYDDSTGNLIAAVDVSVTGEVVTVNSYGNLTVGALGATTVTATANVTGGNIITGGQVVATGNVTSSGNVTGGYYFGNAYYMSGIATASSVYSQLQVQGNTTGNASGNVTFNASTTSGILYPQAGNGITMTGNATTGVLTFSVTGSVNDGTFWSQNNSAGSVADAIDAPDVDNGLVTDASLSASYDLGAFEFAVNAPFNAIDSDLLPTTPNTYVVGNSALSWKSMYSEGNITSASGYFIGNGSLLTGVLTSGGTLSNGNSNISIVSSGGNIAMSVTANANVAVFGTGVMQLKGNLLPAANVAYSLGSSTLQWSSLYVAGNTIYLGNVALKTTAGNTLSVYQADGTTPTSFANPSGFSYNSANITANANITSAYNSQSTGPMTINNNIVVTVDSGATWTIV